MLLQTRQSRPPSPSATDLHQILLEAHAGGNLSRRRFIDSLRALHESRLYLQLGFPDIAAYADRTFRYRRTQVYEFLRVSRALLELPRSAAAFERGELSWSLVSELSRVAQRETEAEWLEFLEGKGTGAILHELRDAREKNRKRPRRDSWGLPGLAVRLHFDFSPEEHAVVEKGLAKVIAEMGHSLDGERPSAKQALLYLFERVLGTEPAGSITGGRAEREDSPFTVVFHRCPDCRRSAVETEDGRVEVEPGALERLAGGAGEVHLEVEAAERSPVPAGERDRPNTPLLRRLLRHREGGRCANPHCRRETGAHGHGHHIVPRSEGGRTGLESEAWLCTRCHAAVHAGALVIEGDSIHGLRFRFAGDDTARRVRETLAEMIGLPHVQSPAGTPSVSRESGSPDSPAIPEDLARDITAALVHLGNPITEARRRLGAAWERLLAAGEAPGSIALERLLRESLRA